MTAHLDIHHTSSLKNFAPFGDDSSPEALHTNLLKSDFYHLLGTHLLFIVDINFSAVMYDTPDAPHKSVKTNILLGH